jgi:branched-subunit amino acid ABC-type transport system permease component
MMALFLSIKIGVVAGAIASLPVRIKKSITIGLAERWKNAFFATQELNQVYPQFVFIPVLGKFALLEFYSMTWNE